MKKDVSKEELFILQSMIEGDEKALKYFFDTYYDDLCNFVNIYLRDETISEDIVQTIFVSFWERRDQLPENCSVKSYLYSASKNRSLNHLRNVKVKSRIQGDLIYQTEQISENAGDRYLEIEELKDLISNAVSELPAKCKTIYQLSRNEGLTNKQISEKLGISVKTVENQMTIAIKKIKAYLHPYYDKIFILFIFSKFF